MSQNEKEQPAGSVPHAPKQKEAPAEIGGHAIDQTPAEIGGRRGPEPTRYGDWENGGKCVDF